MLELEVVRILGDAELLHRPHRHLLDSGRRPERTFHVTALVADGRLDLARLRDVQRRELDGEVLD